MHQATLDVGMNHFWRAKNNKFGGDLIYFQGHVLLECILTFGRKITSKELDKFRQEVDPGGLSSYPHPWLMPNFGSSNCVNGTWSNNVNLSGRFNKYLINRGLLKDEGRKIWCFLGDGEADEPES